MNFPVCAFTTLIERWSVTANVEGNDALPSRPEEPQQAWSVAIDRMPAEVMQLASSHASPRASSRKTCPALR